MAESDIERWSDREFARRYLEAADILILGRQTSLAMLQSFHRHFLGRKKGNRVLDLGCGDGVLIHNLLEIDGALAATLVDGSEDMLNNARERLAGFTEMCFLRATFQELLSDDIVLPPDFDFAVSSLAIHHLNSVDRKALFSYIYSHLLEGGYFVNIDCVRAPAQDLEEWYTKFWEEGMVENLVRVGVSLDYGEIMQAYLAKDHYSKIDTLAAQMTALEEVGFLDVDCFYKRGMFAMYGGRK